jgi:hypothetical protein
MGRWWHLHLFLIALSHSPRRLHCQSKSSVPKISFCPAGYGGASALGESKKRGFVLSTILEPSRVNSHRQSFLCRYCRQGFLQADHSTDRPNDLHKATSCPGDLALFGFSLDVLAAAATAWNFLSLLRPCPLIFWPGFFLHQVIRPDLVRPPFQLLNTDHFSRPDDRGAVHNGHPHADVSPFPPFTFTEFTFAPSERE